MKCHNIQKLLISYSKGELDSVLLKEIETHLVGCDGCQKELQQIKAHLFIYQNLPDIRITYNWSNLLQRIQKENSLEQTETHFWKISAISLFPKYPIRAAWAAIFLLFLGIFLIYSAYPPTWNIKIINGNPLVLSSFPKIATKESTLQLQISPNIEISFAGNTSITLKKYPEVELHTGDIFIKNREKKTFIIHTPVGIVYSKESIFSVHSYNFQTYIKVIEGNAEFRHNEEYYQVAAGQIFEHSEEHEKQCITKINTNQGFPWWEDAPVAIALSLQQQKSRYLVEVSLANLTEQYLTVPEISQENASLNLYVQYPGEENPKLVNCSNNPITISLQPGQKHKIICDLTDFIQKNQEYIITAVCNKCNLHCCCNNDSKNSTSGCHCKRWKGIHSSPPLRVLAHK